MVSTLKYSEQELTAALKQKSETAFTYLYDNYAAALNGIVYRMVEDAALAEDILQEVFVKIWNNVGIYDESKGRLFTWMVRLAKNYTIDVIRSKDFKKAKQISQDENSVSNVQDRDVIKERLDNKDLKTKINLLNEKQRILIDLSYFQGYTQEEIATNLNIPLGTVKTRIRSALIELRKLVN